MLATMMRRVVTVSPSAALAALASALFLLSSGVAMHRALGRGDAWAAAFIAAATALLSAFLATVRAHEPPEARCRGLFKAVARALSAALTAMLAHRVAALSPRPAVAALVWSMAGSPVAGGFSFLLVHGEGYHGGTDTVVAGGHQDA